MKTVLSTLFRSAPLPLIRAGLWAANAKFNVGVVGAFFNPAGRVLVLRHVYRRRWPWGLPAGYLAAGEVPEAGMLRELKEETGLDGRVDRILSVTAVHARHIEIVLSGAVEADHVAARSAEIYDATFCDPFNLPAAIQPNHIPIVRALAEARRA
ncbi:MAG: NUDIX hydrolase [Rhodospirillaceae bacterium]|nr:NUDIX hydrolase [Rhodospirillaceae bacterium]